MTGAPASIRIPVRAQRQLRECAIVLGVSEQRLFNYVMRGFVLNYSDPMLQMMDHVGGLIMPIPESRQKAVMERFLRWAERRGLSRTIALEMLANTREEEGGAAS